MAYVIRHPASSRVQSFLDAYSQAGKTINCLQMAKTEFETAGYKGCTEHCADILAGT